MIASCRCCLILCNWKFIVEVFRASDYLICIHRVSLGLLFWYCWIYVIMLWIFVTLRLLLSPQMCHWFVLLIVVFKLSTKAKVSKATVTSLLPFSLLWFPLRLLKRLFHTYKGKKVFNLKMKTVETSTFCSDLYCFYVSFRIYKYLLFLSPKITIDLAQFSKMLIIVWDISLFTHRHRHRHTHTWLLKKATLLIIFVYNNVFLSLITLIHFFFTSKQSDSSNLYWLGYTWW